MSLVIRLLQILVYALLAAKTGKENLLALI